MQPRIIHVVLLTTVFCTVTWAASDKINCYKCIGKLACKTGQCQGGSCIKLEHKLEQGYNYEYKCGSAVADDTDNKCDTPIENNGDGEEDIMTTKCTCSEEYCNHAAAHATVGIVTALLFVIVAVYMP